MKIPRHIDHVRFPIILLSQPYVYATTFLRYYQLCAIYNNMTSDLEQPYESNTNGRSDITSFRYNCFSIWYLDLGIFTPRALCS